MFVKGGTPPLVSKMPKQINKTTKESPKFEIVLAFREDKYKGSGNTIIKALKGINPKKIPTWGDISIKCGNKKTDIRMRPFQIRRLLAQEMAQIIFEKRVLIALNKWKV